MRQSIAGRLVLRPTREPINHGDQIPYMLPFGRERIGCFVHRTGPGSERCLDAAALSAAAPPDLLVLKLPGTLGRAERSSPMPGDLLPQYQSEIWTWNPPGYGRSSGRATLYTIPVAALRTLDALAEQRCGPETRIWIVGNSLGCAVALHLAANRDVDGLLLRNPPPLVETIEWVAAQNRPRWLRPLATRVGRWFAGGVPATLDTLCTGPHCRAPAVFLQAQQDQLVPPALQQKVREHYGGPWKLIEMQGHQHHEPPTEEHRPQLIEALSWLEQTRGDSKGKLRRSATGQP